MLKSNKKIQKIKDSSNTIAALGDIYISSSITNIKEKLKKLFSIEINEITEIVKKILPSGIFNIKKKMYEDFECNILVKSLLELSIPFDIVIDIVQGIPNKIKVELRFKKGNEDENIFTTNDLRKLIYKELCNLNYEEYGDKIKIWGEHYIRKFGNPDENTKVICEEEGITIPLDYELLEKKLIPELYQDCYQSDIYRDLEILESKLLINNIANEIIDKIRLLNLNFVRYSTLKKLSYDLALQTPHHWFTNDKLKNRHLEYNYEKIKFNWIKYCEGNELYYFAIDLIEHCCALILTRYSLFIGLGKLRPVLTLIKYLELNDKTDGDDLLWEDLEICNLDGDLRTIDNNYNINKLRYILGKLKISVKNVDKRGSDFDKYGKDIYNISTKLYENYKLLNSIDTECNIFDDFINNTIFLLRHFSNIFTNVEKKHIKIREKIDEINMKKISRLAFVFCCDKKNEPNVLFSAENESLSNSIIIIANRKMSNEEKKYLLKNNQELHEDFIFILSIQELYEITLKINRNRLLINLLENSLYV